MKKYRLFALVILTAALSLAALQPAYVAAATTNVTGGTNGPLCNSGGYFTPASVTITSGDTVTFSVPANDPYAGGVQINGFPQGGFVVPRGGSVTTQALTADVSYQGTWPNSPSCIKGSGTVTVQAASSSTPPPPSSSLGSFQSSGNTLPSTTSTAPSDSTGSNAKSTTSTTTAPTSPQSAAPETVVADTITVGGEKITSIQDLTIKQSQPLVLSGTTVPNGKVTLTIHSNPTTATVQADQAGKWSYTVTGLQPGGHTIYATVTDPATGQASTVSKLLAFSVDAVPVANMNQAGSAPARKNPTTMIAAVLGVAVVLVIAMVVLLVVRRRSKKTGALPSPSVVSPAPSASPSAEQQVISPHMSSPPIENINERPKDGNV